MTLLVPILESAATEPGPVPERDRTHPALVPVWCQPDVPRSDHHGPTRTQARDPGPAGRCLSAHPGATTRARSPLGVMPSRMPGSSVQRCRTPQSGSGRPARLPPLAGRSHPRWRAAPASARDEDYNTSATARAPDRRVGAGQAAMATSSRARRRASRSEASLAAVGDAVGGAPDDRRSAALGEDPWSDPREAPVAVGPMRPRRGRGRGAARASRPVAARSGPASAQTSAALNSPAARMRCVTSGNVEDRRAGHRDRERQPRAIVTEATHHQRDQRHQLLTARLAHVVVDPASKRREQGMGAGRVIAPSLPCQEGGELHEARPPSRRTMSAARQDRVAVRSTR